MENYKSKLKNEIKKQRKTNYTNNTNAFLIFVLMPLNNFAFSFVILLFNF